MPIKSKNNKKENRIGQYTHDEEKRLNIPQTGLVSADTDPINGRKTYTFDPHLDPELQWSGKTEGTSFDVDTVSLHVHERIDPLTIIEAVRNREPETQRSLFYYFENPENNLPIREAIEFYKHSEGWSNRLIAGDSLIVMNSLIEKEGMAGKVQTVYIDPPYGIKYGSNFQPFINKRDVKDGKDEDLTQEPEMIKAFRDTWELGIHSYLTYLRNRLLLAKDLLTNSGSIFVQISDENAHHVREILDEIFGEENFVVSIIFTKTGSHSGELLEPINNYILWYAKDKKKVRYNPLFVRRNWSKDNTDGFNFIEVGGKEEDARLLGKIDVSKLYRADPILSSGHRETTSCKIELDGKVFDSGYNYNWKVSVDGIKNLYQNNRIIIKGKRLYYKRYFGDFPVKHYSNLWTDTGGAHDIRYVVETNSKVIERCLLMTTNPGDLVFDPTCGSGTTAFAAEKYGRRWITCDTSRVSIALAKQRLMTSVFDYYELYKEKEGISSGFSYNTVPHIEMNSIANAGTEKKETLYDEPIVDGSKKRITGPFTVEAVPSQRVVNLEEVEEHSSAQDPDNTIARSGETVRQGDWIDEMGKTGIRAKGGQIIKFTQIEALQGTKWLQAQGETSDEQNAVISFGPAYAPLEQRQVELAIEEAQQLVPKPKLVIFASFQFDPEAAKDIDELKWPGVSVIKCQMNTDLLTEDLKKKKANEESSFWLIGQPDIELKKEGEKYIVTVNGFDYYNTRNGEIKSGDHSNIAMWELDTDYNGRSLYPRQVFLPLEGEKGGWNKLAKALRAYVDEDLISNYEGNHSLPFKVGKNKQIAVKIIDDRGIESLRVLKVD